MSLSIRARLTVWYTAVLSLVLAACAAGFYLNQGRARVARVDEELQRVGELLARTVSNEIAEGLDLGEAAQEALEDVAIAGRALAVFQADGTLLRGEWDGMPQAPSDAAGARSATSVTARSPAGAFRVRRSRHLQGNTAFEVGVAEPLLPIERDLAGLRDALLGSLLFGLLLAAGGGLWIAGGALRPVERMAEEAARISGRSVGERLTAAHPQDELGRLAAAFNGLLARLEAALVQQRQFMADASHELRTPVSVARTAIEVTLGRSGRPEGEYRDALDVVAAQMRRLTRLVEDMFTLARADAAGLPLERVPFYLDELVAECAQEARLLAEAKGVRTEATSASDLEMSGDPARLRRMILNLLENGIRHTPAGGVVRVEAAGSPSAVEVTVTDGGPGIPEGDRDRIFARFVRLDPARGGDGAGLGLPIARAIALAHGGSLVLARSDASGSTFHVRLPRTPPD